MSSPRQILSQILRSCQYRWDSRRRRAFDCDLSFSEAVNEFGEPNELYAYLHHYYHHLASPELGEHREYFSTGQRGFGEDAFHAMWWTLLREYHPRKLSNDSDRLG